MVFPSLSIKVRTWRTTGTWDVKGSRRRDGGFCAHVKKTEKKTAVVAVGWLREGERIDGTKTCVCAPLTITTHSIRGPMTVDFGGRGVWWKSECARDDERRVVYGRVRAR